MNVGPMARRLVLAAVLTTATGLMLPALADAHARVSPALSVAGKLQLYSLAIPTEKAGLTTSKIVLTVPSGFGIDSFVPRRAGGHSTSSRPAPATARWSPT